MAAVDRRKSIVFATVVVAALVATGATYLSLRTYFNWNFENSNCNQNLAERGLQSADESALKEFARGLAGADESELWDASIRAERRTLVFTHRFKIPVANMDAFNRGAAREQKTKIDFYCSTPFLKVVRPLLTETIYSFEGERLTSFSIGPADCPQ